MWVCHCLGLKERHIRRAAAAGAHDEASIALACGAGATCGGCADEVRRILDEMLARVDA